MRGMERNEMLFNGASMLVREKGVKLEMKQTCLPHKVLQPLTF
jgi:hypothetical protein